MQPPRDNLSKELDALFEPWNRSDAPGLVVGVTHGGSTLYRKAFGMASLEAGKANTPETRMRIGSTSKHFTCLALLLLAEEGKVDIDAPIGKYVTELQGKNGLPTLRQLMLHRGGIRDYVDMSVLTHGWNSQAPGAALRVQARQRDTNFAPGEAMIYNNGGYHMLSVAAERASGLSFEELLDRKLFQPLGLRNTASVPSDFTITPGMATLHMPGPDGTWRRGLLPTEEVKGEGAIVSTIDDMLQWAAHLRTHDHFGSQETWKALLTPAPGANASRGAYALGLELRDYRGLRTISHSGGVLGGSCEMITLPDHEAEIVILVNGAPGADPSELARKVIDLFMFDDLGPVDPPVLASDYADFLGVWWSAETGMTYRLIDDDGALKVEVCSQPFGIELHQFSTGEVLIPEGGVGEIEFLFQKSSADQLKIRFVNRVSLYRRLEKTNVDIKSLGRAIAGTYYSHDADAIATFEVHGDEITVEFRDQFGSTRGPVVPLGGGVVGIGPLAGAYWCVADFKIGEVRAGEFRIGAMRTRHLAFDRISS